MSTSAEASPSDSLEDLRREALSLRDVPGSKKANLPEARRQELRKVIVGALSLPSVPFEDVARELDAFPPLVVGQAFAAAWGQVQSDRRAAVLSRLKGLESERRVGEALPMAMQLLRSPTFAAQGAEVLSGLPPAEKTTQRLAVELLGEDSIRIENLRTPESDATAAGLWRLVMKAALHEKAQSWRRFQVLRLVLPWLAEGQRFKRSGFVDLLPLVRDTARKLDGHALTAFQQESAKDDRWNEIVGGVAAAARVPPTAETSAPAAKPSHMPTPSAPATSVGFADRGADGSISIEEARSTLQSVRERRSREVRAIDRVLGVLKATEDVRRRLELEEKRFRDEERTLRLEVDELRSQIENLTNRLAEADTKHAIAVAETREREADRDRLKEQVTDYVTQLDALRAEIHQQRGSWDAERQRLESQVVDLANARVQELRQRLATRAEKLLGDLPRAQDLSGNTLAAVLNTRVQELMQLLRDEGVPLGPRG
jgi:hypothetical protein